MTTKPRRTSTRWCAGADTCRVPQAPGRRRPRVRPCGRDIVTAAYLKERRRSRETKELIFISSLAALRAPKAHIQSHIRVALELGLDPRDILEAIEIVLPEAGWSRSRRASRRGPRSWGRSRSSPPSPWPGIADRLSPAPSCGSSSSARAASALRPPRSRGAATSSSGWCSPT